MKQPSFYGLLYVDEREVEHVNLKSADDHRDTYLLCAYLCSKAFRAIGTDFRVITNNEPFIKARLGFLGIGHLPLVPFEFTLAVPKGIPFFSAHYKLEVLHAFANGVFGQQIGLVDLDTVALRPLPSVSGLAVYDISSQIFAAHDISRIRSDMELISGHQFIDARWYGGEFIMGSAEHFAELSKHILRLWPKYLEHIDAFHHIGDEMLMSAVLNAARADGLPLFDYGSHGIVQRWWTARTRHRQVPFESIRGASLLHLPADKKFLAHEAVRDFCGQQFERRYRNYARRKIALRAVAALIDALLRRNNKWVPTLKT